MATIVHPDFASQSRKTMRSPDVVPNVRVSFRSNRLRPDHIRHAVSLCTSIPQQHACNTSISITSPDSHEGARVHNESPSRALLPGCTSRRPQAVPPTSALSDCVTSLRHQFAVDLSHVAVTSSVPRTGPFSFAVAAPAPWKTACEARRPPGPAAQIQKRVARWVPGLSGRGETYRLRRQPVPSFLAKGR